MRNRCEREGMAKDIGQARAFNELGLEGDIFQLVQKIPMVFH